MTEPQIPTTPLVGPELELARVRAALAAGLTFEHGVRLQGATPEELEADAIAFAAEITAANPTPSAPRAGGARGVDVGNGAGTVTGGAERYRQKHPQREPRPVPTAPEQRRNPYAEPSYTQEHR